MIKFYDLRTDKIEEASYMCKRDGKIHYQYSENGDVFRVPQNAINILFNELECEIFVYILHKECWKCKKTTWNYTYIVFNDGWNENMTYPWDQMRMNKILKKGLTFNKDFQPFKTIGYDKALDQWVMENHENLIEMRYSKARDVFYPMNRCGFCSAFQSRNAIYKAVKEKILQMEPILTIDWNEDEEFDEFYY